MFAIFRRFSGTRKLFCHHPKLTPIQALPSVSYFSSTSLFPTLIELTHTNVCTHSYTSAIIITTVLLRSASTLPLALFREKQIDKLQQITPILQAWQHTLKHSLLRTSYSKNCSKEENYQNYTKQLSAAFEKKRSELYSLYDYNPIFNLLLPLAQIPIFVICSIGLRNCCMENFQSDSLTPWNVLSGLQHESLLWVESLTSADSTYLLPCILGVSYWVNVELNFSRFPSTSTSKKQVFIKNALRFLSLAAIPVAASMPAAMNVYWLSSSFFGTFQSLWFRYKKIK